MGKVGKYLLVSAMAFAVFASLGTSAWAATGAGTVVGEVGTLPGITATPTNQAITFSDVVITGSFNSNDNTAQFLGLVDVSGVSASGINSIPMGSGPVNSTAVPFTFRSSNAVTGTVTDGKCSGSYQRVGSIVLVPLNCTAKVGGKPFSGSVNVVSQFTPTQGDGISQPITKANFTGGYVVS